MTARVRNPLRDDSVTVTPLSASRDCELADSADLMVMTASSV